MSSRDAPAPYPPAEHFAEIGGLSFNTSSYVDTTSVSAPSATPLLPQSTPSNDSGSSVILPSFSMADTLSASAALFIAPTTAGSHNGTDIVPTPLSSSSTAPAVRPPTLYSTNHTNWQNASHPAQPTTTQPDTLSSLPKAASFPYTNGTETQNYTVSFNDASRTMLMATLKGSSYSMLPVTETATATGNGQATGTDSPEEEQNSSAPGSVQRSLFWTAATLVLAAAWPC
ncbi:hypothetical protein DOTSEDRAFT_19613 [Dothistroma septosporum NZE10]|uniref:Uncharacterized protein n=1 Tax=Dothistroma septosporum (strain NZE10 / CBS 128990) TaxID=675120 RepID=N1Q3C7_DOTSN|nr:hypothetical protein DOTSEDRAFT_19613 [Dothistroma septosporum NZE10]